MKRLLPFFLPAGLLAVLLAANLFLGNVQLPAAEVWHVLTGQAGDADDAVRFIVLEVRLPQTLTALAAGAALAVAGLLMQTVFSNPLADPSLLGVNSGAALGVAVALLLLEGTLIAGELTLSGFLLTVLAAGAGAGTVIVLLLLAAAALPGRLLLLVTGVMFSFVASALISLLNYRSTAQGMQSFVYWGMGSFSGVSMEQLPPFLGLVLIGLATALLLGKPLDALLLGDDYARNLGVPVRRVRTLVLFVAGGLTAVVTALCGPVNFIGLAVPHAARLTLRTSTHRRLVPATLLWGGCTTLFCQCLTTLPCGSGTLPINAITPLLGVPMVFYILLRRKRA